MTKNPDIDKCENSGFGIGFEGKRTFSFPNGGFLVNTINFGVDISSAVHVDNKKKYILVLGQGPT